MLLPVCSINSIASESEVGTSASSSNSPLTRESSAKNIEMQQDGRRMRAEAMNMAISGNVSRDELQESEQFPYKSGPPGASQGGKDNDREKSFEKGISLVTVTAVLTG